MAAGGAAPRAVRAVGNLGGMLGLALPAHAAGELAARKRGRSRLRRFVRRALHSAGAVSGRSDAGFSGHAGDDDRADQRAALRGGIYARGAKGPPPRLAWRAGVNVPAAGRPREAPRRDGTVARA